MASIIVVGAGPAGATAALLLAQRGVDVTLLERETDFARVFRGEALMPLGLEVLEQMGLHASLSKLPSRLITSWDMYVANKQIFRVFEPQAALGQRAVRIVSQPAFLTHVVEAAQQCQAFRFLPGMKVRNLIQEEGRVVGVIAQNGDGRQQELRADFVLGCDGRGSVVRTRADIKLNLLPESYDVLWFRFPSPKQIWGQTDVMFLGTVKNTGLCYNSFDNHMRYALLMPKGRYRKRHGTDWRQELIEASPPWLADHIRTLTGDLELMLLNVIVGRAEQWYKPGLLLLGDAAHPMSPIRAQGINLALRDVIVMVNHLLPLLQDGATAVSLDAAARAVQAERLPEIERAQTLQLREARGQTNERLRPLMIGMAKLTAPIFGRFSWAQKAWLDQQHDLRFGTVSVKLTV